MHYTQKLKNERIDRDLKQENIAKLLKITKQQYSLYETGRRKIPIDKLKELCIFYGISADYILGLPKGLKYRER